MASVKDLTPYGINLATCRLISEEDFDKLVAWGCKPQVGDVLIAKDGASALDTVCEVRTADDVVLLSSVAILRPNPEIVIPSFLKYWLGSDTTRRYMKATFVTGAAIPRVILKDFERVRIVTPPLPTQRKIADILSAYDDLIENNTRRIKILEEMAQAIYREWFVHFRFPGHEQVAMVETELGLVPEGWESKRLSDISILHRDGVVPSAHGNELFHHYSIPAFDADRESVAEYGHTIRSNKYLVYPESVLLSKLNPRIPRVWLPFLANTHRSIASTEFLVLTALPELNRYFLYGLCNSPEFFERFSSMALGTSTSHQRVKPEDLLNMVLLLPTPQTLEDYATIVEPMLILSDALRRRNANLRQTRDLLLPKLVSGEVELGELALSEVGSDS